MKSHQQIKQSLQHILDKQYADGEERQNREGSIWGGCGADVKRAVAYATDAMRDPLPDETTEQYLESLIARLQTEQARYKDIEEDKDGYGSGTFVEILRDAQALFQFL